MTSNPDVPPFIGYVETTVHALRLIHAARQGVIPRITRRLNDTERRTMIKSGAVFVFSVEESGIKRWTGGVSDSTSFLSSIQLFTVDGLLWSPSRIVGNFLVGCFDYHVEVTNMTYLSRFIGKLTRGRAAAAGTRSPSPRTTHPLEASSDATLQTKHPTGASKEIIPVATMEHLNQMG